ncbi:pre-mRNA-splicing factor prp46 [Entophlyctis sp. JEL0112]|nr:pre-mRNA-splicing factor prp46 [Entophlyctis sp. JEL0112]
MSAMTVPETASGGPGNPNLNHDDAYARAERMVRASIEATHRVFLANYSDAVISALPPDDHDASQHAKVASKVADEWAHVMELPAAVAKQSAKAAVPSSKDSVAVDSGNVGPIDAVIDKVATQQQQALASGAAGGTSAGIVALRSSLPQFDAGANASGQESATALVRIKEVRKIPKPEWHAPWKLMRVISGHLGWVRSIAVDVGNEWFATGAGDRVVKIWDLATGTLKLSLTGHISTVRGLAVSSRHPYLFTCGEDKMVKCWDLEYNKVIRHYHGHLSGVYCMSLHPTLDVLVTGGRDATGRVWDVRTKNQIFALTGHQGTIADVRTQEADPQVITASSDATIKLWDLAAGKATTTLTNHKKSVRALAINPTEHTFASASTDNIKQWKFPRGDFIQNLSGHNSIVNTLSINQDNVMFSGAVHQTAEAAPQPGSLESEAGIFCSAFDQTGARLITGEADKTIKIWKEDERAVSVKGKESSLMIPNLVERLQKLIL